MIVLKEHVRRELGLSELEVLSGRREPFLSGVESAAPLERS
jgi:hypothetical protein